MNRQLGFALALALVASVASVPAQQSASYKLDEHVFNAGGNPAGGVILTSAGFRMTLDSLGETLEPRGLSGASYQVLGGFVTGFPPPGEVTGLDFTDETNLVWDTEPSAGVYNLYRDSLGVISGPGFGACFQPGLPGTGTTDTEPIPMPASGFFYLVTVENSLHQEGTKGFQTGGIPRLGSTCP